MPTQDSLPCAEISPESKHKFSTQELSLLNAQFVNHFCKKAFAQKGFLITYRISGLVWKGLALKMRY